MTASEKEVILKAWDVSDDVAIIKDVATKGKYIEMCIQYLAKRRFATVEDSEKYFQHHVDVYVSRLLRDRLVFKAEDVLKNVGRDFKMVYYQFAFETQDEIAKNAVLEHIRKKDSKLFDEETPVYEAYFEVLKEVMANDRMYREVNSEIGQLKLESLFLKDESYRKRLAFISYYMTSNVKLLRLLEKNVVWDHLIQEKMYGELVLWAEVFFSKKCEKIEKFKDVPQELYHGWDIDTEMFQQALQIPDPPETLKNIFAAHGYIFPDEKENVQKILQRLFTTESLKQNNTLISSLPLAKYITGTDNFSVLLEQFVTCQDLEDIKVDHPDNVHNLDFIISLKSSSVDSTEAFLTLSKSITRYLQRYNTKYCQMHPEVVLCEFLCEISSFAELETAESSEFLKKMPYMQSFIRRIRNPEPFCTVSVADLLKRFNSVDLQQITADAGTNPIVFSNSILSQKYSQPFKLNYMHYIKQHRPAYAVYAFFLDQLARYSQISKSQLYSSAEFVTELVISNHTDDKLIPYCIAYIEMLGFDTKIIRSYIKLLNIVSEPDINISDLIEASETKLFSNLNGNEECFPIREYSAIIQVSKSIHRQKLPEQYFLALCNEDNWWRILVLVQYFDIPLSQIWDFSKQFRTKNIGEHFSRALSYDSIPEKPKRKSSFSRSDSRRKSRQNSEERMLPTTSGDTITTSSSSSDLSHLYKSQNQMKFLQQLDELDLFAIILLGTSDKQETEIPSYQKFYEILNDTHTHSTSVNLLKNAVKHNFAVLAVLSAIVNDRNLQWCWITWLVTAMGLWKRLEPFNDDEVALMLIEKSVRAGHVRTLHQSFQIFYNESKFTYFTKFLEQTADLNFGQDTIRNLQIYILAWSNDNVDIPLVNNNKNMLIKFTVKLIILHLKHNFTTSYYQQSFLDVMCQSGISDMGDMKDSIDFCLMKDVLRIIMFSGIDMDFESLISSHSIEDECGIICIALQNLKQFDKAIELATLLRMPIDDIVYSKWLHSADLCEGNLVFSDYEKETEKYILQPEILVNFYLYVASNMNKATLQKYLTLKKALDVIKKNHLLPNECFDHDTIEFDMIVCYLEGDLRVEELDIYHSEYFEQILLQERCVLYKSFPELKELAGFEEMSTSKKLQFTENMRLKFEILLNRLLDDGDIVEALRLQAMFDCRPIDLHFVVFCMALAEGITNIYNLPNNERQLLVDVEKNSLTKFNRRTLGKAKSSQTSSLSSPLRQTDGSDSASTAEFEEIPSREKQDVLQALQGIVSRLNHGINVGKRIVMVYRSAMYLDKEYLDVLKTKDTQFLLRSAIEEDCLQKLLVISDIFSSTQMSQNEIADFLASEIATAVIRPRFYIFKTDNSTPASHLQAQNYLWGFDLEKEFHLILDLSTNAILLGNALLDYCDALKTYRKFQDNKNYEQDIEDNPQIVNAFDNLREIIRQYGLPNTRHNTTQVLSHKKQNTIYVELLIKVHECFVHECSMEGIANVLNRAKTLNSILSAAKSWNLIVRMLTGIGRYREMYYCFETLIANDQFESLLGQFDDEKSKGLRQAVIQYIREICPQNQEYFRLTALHFLMYKELAEMSEIESNSMIAKIISENYSPDDGPSTSKSTNEPKSLTMTLKCSSELLNQLNHILENFANATENYLLDNKLMLAQKSASNAELIAMQIDLITKGLSTVEEICVCVLNIRSRRVFQTLVNSDLNVFQSLIMERAYSYDINWAEAILNQYIILGRNNYIQDYLNQMELTDSVIENIVKSFQYQSQITKIMEENMSNLIELVQSISLRYKLASILGFKKIITALINDKSLYYLKDTNYGRNEIDFT